MENLYIDWISEYNLGIPIIDEHHRIIVGLINSLSYGIREKLDAMPPIINIMFEYTRLHFETEERFWENIDFPHAREHRVLHKNLLKSLGDEMNSSLAKNDPYEFLDFLKNWWIDHIQNEDMKYRDSLIAFVSKT